MPFLHLVKAIAALAIAVVAPTAGQAAVWGVATWEVVIAVGIDMFLKSIKF